MTNKQSGKELSQLKDEFYNKVLGKYCDALLVRLKSHASKYYDDAYWGIWEWITQKFTPKSSPTNNTTDRGKQEVIEKMVEEFDIRCHYCKKPLKGTEWHNDPDGGMKEYFGYHLECAGLMEV